ncbi:Rac/Rho-like_protein [Hexamita inflata]|uniref:Rac/Rho-like protein n=1 Tax=Hexamita inflata TaxID=28002 RepID=A0AA86UR99_9EUKA|nr:Rac/Rho-like protein [Hexamita inflata]
MQNICNIQIQVANQLTDCGWTNVTRFTTFCIECFKAMVKHSIYYIKCVNVSRISYQCSYIVWIIYHFIISLQWNTNSFKLPSLAIKPCIGPCRHFLHQFYKLYNSCYVPVVRQDYKGQCRINSQLVHYVLDTISDDTCARMRQFKYSETDLFVICYSVTDKSSFEHIRSKWVPEIRLYSEAPLIILGTEPELLNGNELVQSEGEISELVEEIGAQMHLISSCKLNYNMQLVIHQALHVLLEKQSEQQSAK